MNDNTNNIQEIKTLLEKHGVLSVPYIQRHLKCTKAKAVHLLNMLCPEEPMDHSLPLAEFIEKYKSRLKPVRKLCEHIRHKSRQK